MRVIAGERKGMTLYSVEGRDTRPTTDRIKETLFNILSKEVPGCTFLDIFAGTGQMGIEALSRGASRAVFLESGRRAAGCIRENLKKTRYTEKSVLYERDVFSGLSALAGQRFDLLFIDPPYREGLEERVLTALQAHRLCHEESIVILEAELRTELPFLEKTGFRMIREKLYKTNKHVFLTPVTDRFLEE